MIKVIEQRCPKNHKCPAIRVCPVNAIKQEGFSAPVIESHCIDCGQCVKFCPMQALVLEDK